jgi:hypothetical protein
VPVATLTALAVLHEQEFCLAPDGVPLTPFAAEQRLARKLGNPRLVQYVTSYYDSLDSIGHWEDQAAAGQRADRAVD